MELSHFVPLKLLAAVLASRGLFLALYSLLLLIFFSSHYRDPSLVPVRVLWIPLVRSFQGSVPSASINMSHTHEKIPHSTAHASAYSSDDEPEAPDWAGMSVGRYIATRIPTLKPAFDPIPNPFKVLSLLSFRNWMFFLVAFLGWTWYAPGPTS